jgi:type IX secretion system PorP/SprF family membrane protein
MRKAVLVILLVVVVGLARGQQRPQYSLYFQNNYVLNPAITGIEDFTDAKLSYRKQWVGINGSPTTSYASVQGPLGDALRGHAGIGGLVVDDQTGPDSRITVDASFAYHLPLTETVRFALGVSAGITQYTLNTGALTFSSTGETDPAIGRNRPTQDLPDLSLGLWLYSSQFYVGASMDQIIPSQLSFGSGNANPNESLRMHGFITGGIRIPMGDELNFVPSVLVKYVRPTPVSYDLNAKLLFRDYLWVGGSFRRQDGFTIATGINLNALINISYAYDYTTSSLQTVTSGSHEIILGLQLGNRNKVRCPKNLW